MKAPSYSAVPDKADSDGDESSGALFAFVQEYRAERAAAELRDLVPRRTMVQRDGVAHEIEAADLVVGDTVILRAGERVSADLRARLMPS